MTKPIKKASQQKIDKPSMILILIDFVNFVGAFKLCTICKRSHFLRYSFRVFIVSPRFYATLN